MLYGDGIHDDTLALQELLDKRGIVKVDKPGTYLVSRTLVLHSDTRFVLSPGAHLLAAPMSRCALIENEHFAGGGRDRNIGIIGGIWDGNCDAMGLDAYHEAKHRLDDPYSPSLFKGKLIRFAHVDNLVLEKMTVKDPVSYGIQIGDAVGFVTRDLYFDYNCHFGTTDGVHINGPAKNGVIENLHGITNDDMVSLTTIDESHAEVTEGPICYVEIRNISAENGYSGVRLLALGGHEMRGIHIHGVYGTYRHNAILITNHYGTMRPGTPIWFDDIVLEHIHSSKSSTPLSEDCFCMWEKNAIEKLPLVWLSGVKIGNLTMRDISRHETAPTRGPLVQIDPGVNIHRLVMENIFQTTAPEVEAPCLVNEGTVTRCYESNVEA